MTLHPHYFWAIRLPDNIKQKLDEEMQHMKTVFTFKRWVHKSDYHITLAFLGASDQQWLQTSVEKAEYAMKEVKRFSLQIEGLSVFGHKKSPKVFWASTNKEDKLFRLQKKIHQICEEIGFVLDARPFQPHITLARNWDESKPFSLELLESANPFHEPLLFQVEQVVLYKSNLNQVPKYEAIATISLQ